MGRLTNSFILRKYYIWKKSLRILSEKVLRKGIRVRHAHFEVDEVGTFWMKKFLGQHDIYRLHTTIRKKKLKFSTRA